MNKRILRPDEAASYLRVSSRTIYRLITDGHLPAFKVGHSLRIHSKAIEDYIEKQMDKHELVTGYDSYTL